LIALISIAALITCSVLSANEAPGHFCLSAASVAEDPSQVRRAALHGRCSLKSRLGSSTASSQPRFSI
jgi:hypothetical protein